MESQLNYYLGQDDATEKELEASFLKECNKKGRR